MPKVTVFAKTDFFGFVNGFLLTRVKIPSFIATLNVVGVDPYFQQSILGFMIIVSGRMDIRAEQDPDD